MEASTRAQPYITSVSTYNIDNHIHQTVAEVGISKRGGGGLMVIVKLSCMSYNIYTHCMLTAVIIYAHYAIQRHPTPRGNLVKKIDKLPQQT